jgi:hypothetical protein
MQLPPYDPRSPSYADYQAKQDSDQLNLLATLSMAYGILMFFCSAFPLIYVVMGLTVATGGFGPSRNAPPAAFGILFAVIGFVGMAFIWAMGGLALHAAKCLRERRNWTWIMVSACVDCVHTPLGTGLGVFTIIVINRPSVKALFDQQTG